MNIFDAVYFDFYSIAAIIPAIFMAALFYFFITIKNKSKATFHFGVSAGVLVLFFTAYFFAATFYHPNAAFHRWITVATVLPGIVHLFAFIYDYPVPGSPRAKKIVMSMGYIIAILATVKFCITSLVSDKVYHFAGHYYDFTNTGDSKIVSYLIILFFLTVFVITVIRTIKIKTKERWVVLMMGILLSLGLLIPGFTNMLSREGLMDRGTYQVSQDLVTITAFFIVMILYMNTTKDRSTFMSKILAVSLATILLIFQGLSYYALQDMDKAFDQIMSYETKYSIDTGKAGENCDYIMKFSKEAYSLQPQYSRENLTEDIDFKQHIQENYNTLMLEKILALPAENFTESLGDLMDNTNRYFAGYKKGILEYAETLPEDEKDPGKRIAEYIASMERTTLYTQNKIKQLPDENFSEHLEAFLSKAKNPVFNEALQKLIDTTERADGELKEEAVRYLSSMKPENSRLYRRDHTDRKHYVAFMYVNTENDTVYEAGYPYLSYRNYVHSTSTKFSIILILISALILVGFPFFFWGSLVRPIRGLLSGIKEMRTGNLKIQIPVKMEDEFGIMSRSFNNMAMTIREATENLEEKVSVRTEELRAAMEEMEAMNDQLIETRDALWGEMELAKKIQTVLLPEQPEIDGFQIAAHMEAADEVGGDYYDVINVADKNWVVIGDVSGHGVPAGLVMMMVQTAIQTVVHRYPDTPPDELLTTINYAITNNIQRLGESKYMTLTVLAALENGRFMFSGLHQDIFIYRADTGEVDAVETQGMWVGIIDDLTGSVQNDELTMNPGDMMLLYTDGVTEATDANDDMYSEERLLELFKTHGKKTPDEFKNILLGELKEFKRPDDVTFVVIKRT